MLENDNLYQAGVVPHSLREVVKRETSVLVREERVVEYRYFVVRQRLGEPVWNWALVEDLSGEVLERLAIIVIHEHDQLPLVYAHLELGRISSVNEVIKAFAEQKVLFDRRFLSERDCQFVVHDPDFVEKLNEQGLVLRVVLEVVLLVLHFEEQLKALQHLVVIWPRLEQRTRLQLTAWEYRNFRH